MKIAGSKCICQVLCEKADARAMHARPMYGPSQKYSATTVVVQVELRSRILVEIKEKYSRNVAVTVERKLQKGMMAFTCTFGVLY